MAEKTETVEEGFKGTARPFKEGFKADKITARPLILLTGGTGYIGSHCAVALVEAGYRVLLVDNCDNSTPAVADGIARVLKEDKNQCDNLCKDIILHVADLQDEAEVRNIFARYGSISGVIHLAAKKAVGESVLNPLAYYDNNLGALITLLKIIQERSQSQSCNTTLANPAMPFVFSSSATVYGDPQVLPIPEDHLLRATSPYGETKIMCETILRDLAKSGNCAINTVVLRYFNPVGAHPSGLIGEAPRGTPANLVPYVMQVATGKRPHVNVFGNNWPTRDGTGERDYIHIMDLAEAHVIALKRGHAAPLNPLPLPATGQDNIESKNIKRGSFEVFNVGTGRSYTVLEVIAAVERASGKKIPYKIVDPRPGDIACAVADTRKAEAAFNWKATRGIDEMCLDAYRWEKGAGRPLEPPA